MATEYRELNAVIKAIWSVKISPDAEIFNALKRAIEEEVKNIEPADVRPVVRGKWESVMLDHERMGCRPTAHYCSECLQITWFRTFYCPNCGADMRQEREAKE